jgi:hypothetical protein
MKEIEHLGWEEFSEEFVKALNDWCLDHYKNFDCYPGEFQFFTDNDDDPQVYNYDQFQHLINHDWIQGQLK